jgi:ABC-type phosphate transport system substrate-binding protein
VTRFHARRCLTVLAAAAVLAAAPVSHAADAYKVVVNAQNPETQIGIEQLASLFLKDMSKWSRGTAVLPVDQPLSSPTRAAFSRDVFGQPVLVIEGYWRQQITSGRKEPPPIKTSDKAVVDYVAANVGAVGYVAAATTLPAKVKVLAVTVPSPEEDDAPPPRKPLRPAGRP